MPAATMLKPGYGEYQMRADRPVGVDQGMESLAGSRIGPSLQIVGEIVWRGSLQVAGTCQGSLTGGDLGIAPALFMGRLLPRHVLSAGGPVSPAE
jgi:hypothetical protein